MASSLDKKQVDELIEKYSALAEKKQRRVDELEKRNAHLAAEICSGLIVPASAFGLSYVRAYYGERASILGIPIDSAVGLFLHGLAACFGFSLNKTARTAAKIAHDVANGAFASWASATGAELGLKKRMERPLPAPQPNTGAREIPPRPSRPMTHEDLAAITAAIASNGQPAMPEPQPVHAPLPAPTPSLPPLNGQPAPVMMSANPSLPPTPQKPFRFTQRWAVDPEADMRALLQSVGVPADSNTVNHLLTHENPGDEFKVILQRARAPA